MRELLRYLHAASAIVLGGQLLMAMALLAASLKEGGDSRVARYVQAILKGTGRAIALPAMVLLFVTGIGLTHLSGVRWSEAIWVWASLGLFLIFAGAVWHGMMIPLRKKMQGVLEGAEAPGPLPDSYRALARSWLTWSGVCLALIAVVLALMIWKPKL